jgi:hypothetical protein
VYFYLNETDKEFRNNLKDKLNNISRGNSLAVAYVDANRKMIGGMESLISIDQSENIAIESELQENDRSMNYLFSLWSQQELKEVNASITKIGEDVTKSATKSKKLRETLIETADEYNSLIDKLDKTEENLERLRAQLILNESNLRDLKDKISEFNSLTYFLIQKQDINQKKTASDYIYEEISILYEQIFKEIEKESLKKDTESFILMDILCILNQTCVTHPTTLADSRADLIQSCIYIDQINSIFSEINKSINMTLDNESGITMQGIRNNLSAFYLLNSPPPQISVNESLIPALLSELLPQKPKNCELQ